MKLSNFLNESKKIIAYHGSGKPEMTFSRPNGVYWFAGNRESTIAFATHPEEGGVLEGEVPTLYTVELTFDKPMIIKDDDEWYAWGDITNVPSDKKGGGKWDEYRQRLFDAGFDSIVYPDWKYYVSFKPEQVKIIKKEAIDY